MRILFIVKDIEVEPLGIMYLTSSLKHIGNNVDIIKSDGNIKQEIKKFQPHVIGYSITTGEHKYYIELNKNLKKEFEFLSIFGGAHATIFPEETIYEDGVDIVCRGDGEEPMVDLANQINSKKSINKIKSLWIKSGKRIIKNNIRDFVNLDEKIFPDREVLYSKYRKCLNKPIKYMITSRGCPYDCSYCFNHIYQKIFKSKGNYLRRRSVQNVIKEASNIKKNYPVKMIYFQDDNFIIDFKWMNDFSKQYSDVISLPFHCHVRIDLVNQEIIKILKRAGCYSLSFAVETGNEELRYEILRRKIATDKILSVAKMLREANIRFRIFNMLNIPGGSFNNDMETLRLNIKCKTDYGWASICQPYPKTDLYIKSTQIKICDKITINDFNNYNSLVLNTNSSKKIFNLQKLFSIFVSYPILYPFIRLIVNFPPNFLFEKLFFLWKKHCYNKIYITK